MREKRTGTVSMIETEKSSGIAVVHFEDGTICFIDGGFGARQLQGAIMQNSERQIIYEVDHLNVMVSFDFESDHSTEEKNKDAKRDDHL